MSTSFYVYELIDPRNGQVFYVGKGRGNRLDAHEKEARAGRISRKCDVIRSIEAAGLAVSKRKIGSFDDEQEAYDREAELVEEYGLAQLTNVVPGGGVARDGPTIYGDRNIARFAAEIINRTRNGEITRVLVAGDPLDLAPIVALYRERAIQVAKRRGFDWVNSVCARFGVRFEKQESVFQ